MTRHMTLHEDVIERVLNILKQDDYYRTLEDLPVIDELMAYDDIKLFPELYDTSTIIERVTAEADLIERQLKRPGMYPQHTDLSQNNLTSPKPTLNLHLLITAEIIHLRVHCHVDKGHRLHRPALQMRHLHQHNTHHQTHKNNIHLQKQILTHLHSLSLQEKIINVYQNLQMAHG